MADQKRFYVEVLIKVSVTQRTGNNLFRSTGIQSEQVQAVTLPIEALGALNATELMMAMTEICAGNCADQLGEDVEPENETGL